MDDHGVRAGMDDGVRLRVFRTALTARRFEERITLLAKDGEVPSGLHLGAGQEVCQVAALAALRDDDPMLYGHRGTAYWIARGIPLDVILCDIACRDGGTNRGKGGVMHVVDPARGVLGESGTLGGNFVIGAGVAYAERYRGTKAVTIVFFGDGTSNRGQFHEAANFAGVQKLPLILFCENNGYGLSVPVEASTAVVDIADRAAGYGMPGVVVDGSDPDAVFAATAEAARRARAGEGPTLIEAKVNRIGGHWLADQQRYRSDEERERVRALDPLPRHQAQLVERGVLTDTDVAAMEAEVTVAVEEAVAVMRSRDLVAASTVLDGLFASGGRGPSDSTSARGSERASPERTNVTVRRLRYSHAIREALAQEMRRDDSVVTFGEDVGVYGGIWAVLRGLHEEFGDRVFDTPISENLIVGMAVGMAMRGLRPVAELQYADFVFCAGDEVFLKAATWRYAHDGAFALPMVVRMASGGSGYGPEHSQCTEAYLMHTPGLRVAVPSTPADAKGLMTTAIRSDDPVFFFEHKNLYSVSGPVPEGEHLTPFGVAAVRREGDAVTVVAWQDMLRRTLEAAERLAGDGIEVEVIDPVTLSPLDTDTIVTSVRKTGACVIVEEAPRTLGVGAELGAVLMEQAFDALDRPLVRLAMPDVPVPAAPHLVDALVPTVDDIVAAVTKLVTW